MDTRDTPEQAELRRSAGQLARELGPRRVADLDDGTRAERLAAAVRAAGWLELRDDGGDGEPLAGGVEAAIVAEALGAAVADTGFAGPLLARDLARRAGVSVEPAARVAFAPDLLGAAVGATATTDLAIVLDGGGDRALVLAPAAAGLRLAEVPVAAGTTGADLTRPVRTVPTGTPVLELTSRPLTEADLSGWVALGLALTSADLVGVMRGVLDISVAYAGDRRQFDVPIGSFQSVQHLLADAHCMLEGARSITLRAAWGVDHLPPDEARAAGRMAKAYCSRAARTVCETAVQVHGGIGNTWDCFVHVYLRRALLSSQWFGDDGVQVRALERERLGVPDGLP